VEISFQRGAGLIWGASKIGSLLFSLAILDSWSALLLSVSFNPCYCRGNVKPLKLVCDLFNYISGSHLFLLYHVPILLVSCVVDTHVFLSRLAECA
jgi:hypothetical protein